MRSFFATVVALLPAIALAAPSGTCTPTGTFLAAGAKVVSQSSLPSSFWEAEVISGSTTFFALQNLPESDDTPATQTWNIKAVNGGFAFQNGAFTGSNSQCIQGNADDGGAAIDNVACPDFDNGNVPDSAVWTITCNNGCGDNFALGCTIQAKTEGQCAQFNQPLDNLVFLENCNSTAATQVWDIALA